MEERWREGGRGRGRTGERNLDVTMDNGMKDGALKIRYSNELQKMYMYS
jgi:hypothetical protein